MSDGIFCAIRGVARSLLLRKSMGSSSIHQLQAYLDCRLRTWAKYESVTVVARICVVKCSAWEMQGSMDAVGTSDVGSSSKRGVKRQADESNDDTLRFTKRFNLLSLGTNAQRYGLCEHNLTPATPDPRSEGSSNYYIPVTPPPTNGASTRPTTEPAAAVEDDSMNIDDTRDRVYVQNLDAELAEIEANESDERLIFLPDIEKHFSRIPQHLLAAPKDVAELGRQKQELVLYSVPKSLTVDESQDSVRKAVLEARQRARDKAIEEARHEDMERQYAKGEVDAVETAHGYSAGYGHEEPVYDTDAMDIE